MSQRSRRSPVRSQACSRHEGAERTRVVARQDELVQVEAARARRGRCGRRRGAPPARRRTGSGCARSAGRGRSRAGPRPPRRGGRRRRGRRRRSRRGCVVGRVVMVSRGPGRAARRRARARLRGEPAGRRADPGASPGGRPCEGQALNAPPASTTGNGPSPRSSLARDRARGQGQLARSAFDQAPPPPRRPRRARCCTIAGQGGDAVLGQTLLVDARHQLAHRRDLEGFEDDRHDPGRGPPSVGGAHGRAQGLVPEPISGALVREQEAEASRARAGAGPSCAVRDRPRAGEDDDARPRPALPPPARWRRR